ncbi:MAG: molybdenum cofactor biosynthesis protein [Thermoplasmata archaeon]|nr:MAG: molybdenum cofactor biosynthesis protein [Thermoplasmata archaeon]
MKPFHRLISFEEAKKIIMENTKEIERIEEVDILEAVERVLAIDIHATFNVPGFKRAAMDGYAVKAEDTFNASLTNPKKLKLVGKIFAGEKSDKRIGEGECMQIATGAALPQGSDAVVMVEDTERHGNYIAIHKPVYPGANVSQPDEDIKKGCKILGKGEILNPPKIGVLAALGIRKVKVYEKPKVEIFPTGKEVVELGKRLEEGKIYDINSYTLASLLKKAGSEARINKIVDDDKKDIEEAIEKAKNADYVIFSGGSSVGEKDILADVIEKKGKLLFHGIAVKPGKPTICGVIGNAIVLGMPGYPTSCLTNAYVLLLPSIKKMARLPFEIKRQEVTLAKSIASTIGRYQIYPVKVKEGKAYPAFKESGAITSMSMADGYIEIPANVEFIEEGSKVIVTYF